MNEIILHPDRNFLDSRNPSSPFRYMIDKCFWVWKYIEENLIVSNDGVAIDVNNIRYLASSKTELFEFIKSNWGA